MTEPGTIQMGTLPGGASRPGSAVPAGFVDRAAGLPLAAIAAAMLAAATAFFCYAMPQRVLGAVLGVLGMAGSVGGVGRTLFLLFCTGLAGIAGWLAVTAAGRGGPVAEAGQRGDVARSDARGIAPIHPPGTIQGAPPPLPGRRAGGDANASPGRVVLPAHDLSETAIAPIVEPGRAAHDPAPGASTELISVSPEPALPASSGGGPFLLNETVPVPQPLVGPQERTIAALLARFEHGLDRRSGSLPPPPGMDSIVALRDALATPEDTLRTALDTLQRISARPHRA